MVSNAAYYSRHLDFRFLGFRPINWSGFPYLSDYPSLHFYLIQPLLHYFGAQKASLLYTMGAMYFLALSSYFLFWTISRNVVLSSILAILGLYSIGTWGPVVWGGNLQYFATMPFLPLSMVFLVLYLQSKSRKNLLVAIGILGISALGHPQVMVTYAIPFTILLLVFGYYSKIKVTLSRRLADVGIFLTGVILISYLQLQTSLGLIFLFPLHLLNFITNTLSAFLGTKSDYGYAVPSNISSEVAKAIAAYNRAEFWRFKLEVNGEFFVFAAFAAVFLVVGIVLARNRKRSLGVLPFILFLAFLFGYNFALSRGFSLFHGGWYRVFWPMPIAFGALISFSYQSFWFSFLERVKFLNNFTGKTLLIIIFSAVIAFGGYNFWSKSTPQDFIDKLDVTGIREKSGVFPEGLNKPMDKSEFSALSKKLVPTWLPANENQYRLYSADQKVNIWWPTFYEMPLFRGYIDAPIGTDRAGGYYWTDLALSATSGRDSLVEDYKSPVEMAKNNALFLIDWYSVGYYEGGHEGSDSYTPPASYLLKDSAFEKQEEIPIPGYSQVYQTEAEGGKIKWHDEISHSLKYFKFKEGLASPIASASNSTTIGFVGTFNNYETFLRVLGMTNTNSKQVIPLWLSESLKDMPNLGKLNLDGLVLYGYLNGDNKSGLKKIENYVKNGGKLIIETGSDVYQTNQKKLPEFFPIEGTKRQEIGSSWELGDFGPPVLDDKPWLFSLPVGLKSGSEVILKVGETPLVVSGSFGNGKVIWSGTNFFFHANVYKNLKEGEFLKGLISKIVLLETKSQPQFRADFISNRKIKIETKEAKAVLLRQQIHPGWQAKVNGVRQQIYKTGPTYPGFMYVFIPSKLINEKVEVEFLYKGEYWTLFYTVMTVVILMFIIDYLLGVRLGNFVAKSFRGRIGLRVSNWWEKEDE